MTSVVGDLIHVYRSAKCGWHRPNDDSFSVLATRTIDPDQTSTYYTDSTGGSAWWYKMSYFNAVSNAETALADSEAVRGDDFGHYCTIPEIRSEAGFANAYNLRDSTIDQQRRAAEAEVNSTLRSAYTIPFGSPVPQRVKSLTIKLAAGFLLQSVYNGQSGRGDPLVKDVRAQLKLLQSGGDHLTDDTQTPYTGSHVASWPNDSTALASNHAGSGPIFGMNDRL